MILVSKTTAASLFFVTLFCFPVFAQQEPAPREISGLYPHLAMFNDEDECGTGAVVPWADRLWAITYGPHLPMGSSDKLYEITPDLRQIVRPESVGGTHANRLIHRESKQLFLGPYAIDENRNVRVIPPKNMPGRLTGIARHLSDPERKICYATMEEGLYEVDVNTLDVTGIIKDGNANAGAAEARPATISSELPGYHGKGLFSGQGRLVYANNGERGERVMLDPSVPSGALAQWSGSGDWNLVRRNQFTEVSGPGGIYGNDNPETDPIWSIGWDHRSLILMVLHEGKWNSYRLPKASHTYDGAHGWHTEWPRIRSIGPEENANELLMTMHGTFWRFPRNFTSRNSSGIVPRSTYLKVIGDFCYWNGRLVCACDDAARSEFTNKRKVKGTLAGPAQSQSNLWFLAPESLDELGPLLGRGGPWVRDDIQSKEYSEPYLLAGYQNRILYLSHRSAHLLTVKLEIDENGDGNWMTYKSISVAPGEKCAIEFFPENLKGAWIRLQTDRDAKEMTALFHYRNNDARPDEPATIFDGLARNDEQTLTGGVLHARGGNFRTLRFIAKDEVGLLGVYDLDGDLNLVRKDDPAGLKWTSEHAAIPVGVLEVDEASVLLIDEKGRWRLPKSDSPRELEGPLGPERVCREVATERDLLHAHGTFYELPAENSGGIAKIRPIASHAFRITDYASYRGMIVLSGLSKSVTNGDNPHIVRSEDGKCALWCGVIDDLWRLGKARGVGGPWKDAEVKANEPSDPYLMSGYDIKSVTLKQEGEATATVRIELDLSGDGHWHVWREVPLDDGKSVTISIPLDAYWIRFVCDKNVTATAMLKYE